MSSEDLETAPVDDPPTDETNESDENQSEPGPAELRAEIELLEEENQRLRDEYARMRQTRYRRTALSLAGLGVVATVGGLLFPQAQSVLFALGGTGAFLGLLTYYLSPEEFLPASIGRTVYAALARNEASAVAELGLRDDRVYIPTPTDDVRLFVPRHADYAVPNPEDLGEVFLVTEDDRARGIALEPTGDGLADEFEQAVTGGMGDDPATLATQLSDALVEQFELLDTADPDVDPDGGRLTVAVDESAYGALDRFDHPVVSFLASAMARELEMPVTAEVETVSDGQGDYLVTLTWDADTENESDS